MIADEGVPPDFWNLSIKNTQVLMAKSFTTWLNHRKRAKLGATAMHSDDMHLVRPFDIAIDVRTCFSPSKTRSAADARAHAKGSSYHARHLVLETLPTIKCSWKMTSLIVQVPIEHYSQFLGLLESNFAMLPSGAAAADKDDAVDADSAVSKPIPEASTAADTSAAATAEAATAKSMTTSDTTSTDAVATQTRTSTATDSVSWDVDFSIENFQFALLARTPAASDDILAVRHLLTLRMAALQARAQCKPRMQQVKSCVVIMMSLLGRKAIVAFVSMILMLNLCLCVRL